VRELIALCGGMADGHEFKGYLPGGASGGILPASKGDIPLDFGGPLADEGCFVGSHAVVVLSDKDNMWDAATNLMQFFAHESCGQCTPCREGTGWMYRVMSRLVTGDAEIAEIDALEEVTRQVEGHTICALGDA
ncbi:MAG TPA: NADH-quinone oxidoreductase subunit F, partial [Alphaproteobacteria bacterium]|nr:NADH-quinone oxidoreductase subunit F [Alphaproteobacteria bacterium]